MTHEQLLAIRIELIKAALLSPSAPKTEAESSAAPNVAPAVLAEWACEVASQCLDRLEQHG